MATASDILILGGGAIGLTTAFFLAREGTSVTLIDKGDFGQESSWAGAGILPPGNPQQARTPFDRLRALSTPLFPALSQELREIAGIDNGYVCCGGLEFLGPSVFVGEEWHGEGVACEVLDETAVAKLEPGLSRNLGSALLLPDLAQLRNPRHLKALCAACSMLGVQLRPGCAAHGFVRKGEQIQGVRTNEGLLTAGQFLMAIGAWTDPLLENLGYQLGIQPVRGQIALLHPSAAPLRRILLWGNRYLVPRADGRVLVGSTEEHVGYDKRTTAVAIADLLRLACDLVPSLAQAPLERCWAGLRPGSPDGLPFLGPVPGFHNLFIAAGHFRAGLQLSPGTARLLKEVMLGQELSLPLDPYRPDRLAG